MYIQQYFYQNYIYFSFLGFLTLTTFLPSSSQAKEKESRKEVVVSASRVPVAANKVGSTVTVVTAKDIERIHATSVAEILRTVPGIAVSQTGSRGGNNQIRFRGAEANHTLVIIDGIEVNDPSRSSEFDFAHLSVSNIERIEVIRGPQSALYGSDAIGGVIIIHSKKGGQKRNRKASSLVRIELGSDNTLKSNFNTRGGNSKFNYSLGLSTYKTDGYSSANELRGATEKDAYENKAININLRTSPSENIKLFLNLRKLKAETDTDGFSGGIGAVDANNNNLTNKLSAKVGGQFDLLDGRWTHKLAYAVANTNIDSFSNNVNSFSSKGKKLKLDYQNSLVLGGNDSSPMETILITAIEREQEEAFTTFSGGKRVIRNLGYIIEHRLSYRNRLFSSFAARFDDNDIFEDAKTGRATFSWLPGGKSKYRFHASYGTGVKNPTLFELFGSTATFTGNPNLKPESAKGWDTGVEINLLGKKLKLDFTYFKLRVTNLITGSGTTSINLNGVSPSEGLEIGAKWQMSKRSSVSASYTYMDAKTATSAPQVRRPRHHLALNVNYQLSKKSNFNLAYIGKSDIVDFQFDASFNRTIVPLDNYSLVHLLLKHKINKRYSISAKIENLFDEEYEEVLTYGTPRRSFFVSLSGNY